MSRPGPSDRGAATLLVVALCGVLVLVGLAAAGVGGLVVAQRRAQAAADLAALGGAAVLASAGTTQATTPCAVAAEVARANGATLIRCELVAADVVVEVSVPALRGQRPAAVLTATARAGPA